MPLFSRYWLTGFLDPPDSCQRRSFVGVPLPSVNQRVTAGFVEPDDRDKRIGMVRDVNT